jgi:asparagine synthetase B (glutamine-hydrolysing)
VRRSCGARSAKHKRIRKRISATGTFADERLLLGMRRLSIIDLAGGHQPIANEDETIQVVCKGPRPAW